MSIPARSAGEGDAALRALLHGLQQGFARGELLRDRGGRAVACRVLEINPAGATLIGCSAEMPDTASRVLSGCGDAWIAAVDRALRTGHPAVLEQPAAGRWLRMHLQPTGGDGFVILFDDVSERRRAEASVREARRRTDFLLSLNDALLPLADATAIATTACRLLANQLGSDRVQYTLVDGEPGAEIGEVRGEFVRSGAPMSRRHAFTDYGETVVAALRAGETLVLHDTDTDPRLSSAERAAFRAASARAAIAVPLSTDGRVRVVLTASMGAPRMWTAAEVQCVKDVAVRTWEAIQRARAEAALRESEAELRHTVELNPHAPWTAGADGRIETASPRWQAWTGCAGIGDAWQEVLHPDEAERIRTAWADAVAAGAPLDIELRVRMAEGDYRWMRVYGRPRRDDNGGIVRWYGTTEDIHDRKLAELALRESEARYRQLFDSMEEGYSVMELVRDDTGAPVDYRHVEINRGWERHTGVARETMLGRTQGEVFSVSGIEPWLSAFMAVLEDGRPRTIEGRVPTLDRWFEVRAFRLGPERVAIFYRDISTRRKAEQAASENAQRQSFLLELSDAFRDVGDPLEIQRLAASLVGRELGVTRASYFQVVSSGPHGLTTRIETDGHLAAGVRSAVGTHHFPAHEAGLARLQRQQTLRVDDIEALPAEDATVRENGTAWDLRAILAVPVFRGGSLVGGLVLDDVAPRSWSDFEVNLVQEAAERVREALYRAQAEAALAAARAEAEQQRRMYEVLMATNPDVMYIVDRDHRFRYANPALLRMWGRNAAEIHGQTLVGLGYPQDEAARYEREIDHVLASGEAVRGEAGFSTAEQGWRVYDYIFAPLAGADGSIEAVFGIGRDVTDRVQAEEALRTADQAKDEFLAMLGHELRNPLGAASNALALLKSLPAPDPGQARAVAVLERQLGHITRLVDDLLDVSRVTQGKIRLEQAPVALDEVVAAVVNDFERAIADKGLRLRVDLTPGVTVHGDALRLAQVAANLIDNALKYTREGSIEVSLRCQDDRAELQVCDTGVGIESAALPHVFDLFSQSGVMLARSQGGLGIGLTVARRLVDMHEGTIRADSAGPGTGSTFTVTLPRVAAAPPPAAPDPAPANTARALRVLVVDDNVDGAEALADMLQLWGHEAQAVHDGPAGLEAVAAMQPDVVLLDLGLPGLDGYEVAARLRAQPGHAGLKIFALTGYGQAEDRARTAAAGFDHHLVKPLDFGALEALLASV